uniref:Uncharacterized protein n=1 Tax=Entomoneis paludosa TaxID=265537 RepID=A0A7S2VDZ9_9STRA
MPVLFVVKFLFVSSYGNFCFAYVGCLWYMDATFFKVHFFVSIFSCLSLWVDGLLVGGETVCCIWFCRQWGCSECLCFQVCLSIEWRLDGVPLSIAALGDGQIHVQQKPPTMAIPRDRRVTPFGTDLFF